MDKLVGTTITLSNGERRVLRKDKKGFYVIKGGIKNYVDYHAGHTFSYFYMTGEWDHK